MKILIIRFSSIGDIVLTTPVVRCMKMQLPSKTEIHYLCKLAHKGLLTENKYIDKIWVLQPNLSQTIRDINAQKFDYIIDLQNNLRTFFIKLFGKSKVYSVDKLNFRKFLLTQFKINAMPTLHIVDRYFETVMALDVKNDQRGLDYFNPSASSEIYDATEITPQLNFIALAIGGQHATKRMPLDKLSALVHQLNYTIVLLGGKEDKHTGELLGAMHKGKVIDLSGKLSLNQSAGVLALSQAVITHDTGMMHIAAALQKPIIALWGNTVPEFGMGPYYGANEIGYYNSQVSDLKCRPCHKLGHESCPKGHFKCMNLQNIQSITEALNKVMA